MTVPEEGTVVARHDVRSRQAATDLAGLAGSHEIRAARMSLMSISLGTAGLGCAWQAAATTHPAALPVSDPFFTLRGLVWPVLLLPYLRHGEARWHHLRHPGRRFALAYLPLIGMLITGHFSRAGTGAARGAYAVLVLLAALIAVRLQAH
ncbi:hypothetical protein ACFV7R_25580 [Streptomyces sp. NPDC059866]|uniref:hypothetical protein n=1 Tax=Streptomyces sp. NPDC059866 TaxID=3346978 RepID=UPI00365B3891